jgi:hypothetical protein
VRKSCILVDYTGHLASNFRDSTIYLRIIFFDYDPQKDAKTKKDFHGVSRNFRAFKVPTKLDGGKQS